MSANDIMAAVEDALEIVTRASLDCATGPHQPWRFLQHVKDHLQAQLTAQFENAWAEMRQE